MQIRKTNSLTVLEDLFLLRRAEFRSSAFQYFFFFLHGPAPISQCFPHTLSDDEKGLQIKRNWI